MPGRDLVGWLAGLMPVEGSAYVRRREVAVRRRVRGVIAYIGSSGECVLVEVSRVHGRVAGDRQVWACAGGGVSQGPEGTSVVYNVTASS